MAAQQEKGNQKGLIQKLCKQMLDDTYPLMRTERPVQTGRLFASSRSVYAYGGFEVRISHFGLWTNLLFLL